jgi:hypothetical protein
MAKFTNCPITRSQFQQNASPVTIIIRQAGHPDVQLTGEVKEFSTGSLGWYANGKVDLHVGDIAVKVQCGGNLTIVGSKDLPKDQPS